MTHPPAIPPSDPFVEALDWLVHHVEGGHGSVATLSERSGIAERTLRAWWRGEYPRRRNSVKVDSLHLWALAHVADYPPPAGTLVAHAGPGRGAPRRPPTSAPAAGAGEPVDSPPSPDHGDASTVRAPRNRPVRRWMVVGLGVATLLAGVAVVALAAGWWRGGPAQRPVATSPTVVETAANHRGSPVYRDERGTSVGSDIPQRIPYGTVVEVVCHAPNRTGQTSVTALYLLHGGRWDGLYAVSDTFTNGDPFGSAGPTTVDPKVPACPAASTPSGG